VSRQRASVSKNHESASREGDVPQTPMAQGQFTKPSSRCGGLRTVGCQQRTLFLSYSISYSTVWIVPVTPRICSCATGVPRSQEKPRHVGPYSSNMPRDPGGLGVSYERGTPAPGAPRMCSCASFWRRVTATVTPSTSSSLSGDVMKDVTGDAAQRQALFARVLGTTTRHTSTIHHRHTSLQPAERPRQASAVIHLLIFIY